MLFAVSRRRSGTRCGSGSNIKHERTFCASPCLLPVETLPVATPSSDVTCTSLLVPVPPLLRFSPWSSSARPVFCVVSQKVTSSGSCLLIGQLVSCGLVVGGGVQLMTSALRSLPGRQSVWRLQRRVTRPPAAAGGEVGPEGWRVEAVDDRVAAGVQVPKHKEGVVDVLRCDLQHAGLKPVPDPQQVVRSPAHDKGQHDDHRHLQSLHPSLWDDVSATATQVRLPC